MPGCGDGGRVVRVAGSALYYLVCLLASLTRPSTLHASYPPPTTLSLPSPHRARSVCPVIRPQALAGLPPRSQAVRRPRAHLWPPQVDQRAPEVTQPVPIIRVIAILQDPRPLRVLSASKRHEAPALQCLPFAQTIQDPHPKVCSRPARARRLAAYTPTPLLCSATQDCHTDGAKRSLS